MESIWDRVKFSLTWNREESASVNERVPLPMSAPTSPSSPLAPLSVTTSVASVDRYKRKSLHRLASIGGGRELLKQFEQAAFEFAPRLCSTLASSVAASSRNQVNLQDKEAMSKNGFPKSPMHRKRLHSKECITTDAGKHTMPEVVPLPTKMVTVKIETQEQILSVISEEMNTVCSQLPMVLIPPQTTFTVGPNEANTEMLSSFKNEPLTADQIKEKKMSEDDIRYADIFTDDEEACTAQQQEDRSAILDHQPETSATKIPPKCTLKETSITDKPKRISPRKSTSTKCNKQPSHEKSNKQPSHEQSTPHQQPNQQPSRAQSSLHESNIPINWEEQDGAELTNGQKLDLRKSLAPLQQELTYQLEQNAEVQEEIMKTDELDGAAPEYTTEINIVANELLPAPPDFGDATATPESSNPDVLEAMEEILNQAYSSSLADDLSCDQVSLENNTVTKPRRGRGCPKKPLSTKETSITDKPKRVTARKSTSTECNKQPSNRLTSAPSNPDVLEAMEEILNQAYSSSLTNDRSSDQVSLENNTVTKPRRGRGCPKKPLPMKETSITDKPKRDTPRKSTSTECNKQPSHRLSAPPDFGDATSTAESSNPDVLEAMEEILNQAYSSSLADDLSCDQVSLENNTVTKPSRGRRFSGNATNSKPPAKESTGVRRSKRDHRLCPPIGVRLLQVMYQNLMDKRMGGQEKGGIKSYTELLMSQDEVTTQAEESQRSSSPTLYENTAIKRPRQQEPVTHNSGSTNNILVAPIYEQTIVAVSETELREAIQYKEHTKSVENAATLQHRIHESNKSHSQHKSKRPRLDNKNDEIAKKLENQKAPQTIQIADERNLSDQSTHKDCDVLRQHIETTSCSEAGDGTDPLPSSTLLMKEKIRIRVKHLEMQPNMSQVSSGRNYALSTAEPSYVAAPSSGTKTIRSAQQNCMNARVRLKRTEMPVLTPATAASCSKVKEASFASDTNTTSTPIVSNTTCVNREFGSWLRNASNLESATSTSRYFKDMYCLTAGDIVFRDVQGIECAFYDTKRRVNIGYLRFRPQQIKPFTVARIHKLHFVVIIGTFKVITDSKTEYVSTGDMIVILKGSRYSMTNMTEDVAVLMIIKQ